MLQKQLRNKTIFVVYYICLTVVYCIKFKDNIKDKEGVFGFGLYVLVLFNLSFVSIFNSESEFIQIQNSVFTCITNE